MGKKTKSKRASLTRSFKRARVNFPIVAPQQINTHLASVPAIMDIARTLGRSGDRAIEDIRQARQMMGGSVKTFDPNRLPGNGEWTDAQGACWDRYSAWHSSKRRKTVKARRAAIYFVEGYRNYQIEGKLHIRNGSARRLILLGIIDYCEFAGWTKKVPPPR